MQYVIVSLYSRKTCGIKSKVFSNIRNKIHFPHLNNPLNNGLVWLKQLPGELFYVKKERKVKKIQD